MPLNTTRFPLIVPKHTEKRHPRSRMILACGTIMNSGKSVAAAACCWVLSNLGYTVKGSKITGTDSLKDILHMREISDIVDIPVMDALNIDPEYVGRLLLG